MVVRDGGTLVTPENWNPEAWGSGYRLWSWEFGAAVANPIEDWLSGAPPSPLYRVEDKLYIKRPNADYSRVTFVQVDPFDPVFS